jgi:hypothetical protein
MSSDAVTKLSIAILTALILGAYKWVWDTNEEVTVNALKLQHIQEKNVILGLKQQEAAQFSQVMREDISQIDKKVYGIDRDMDYIKAGIDEIKRDLKELKEK